MRIHDNARTDKVIGDFCRRQPQLLAENHGENRPDHAAQACHHLAEEENVDFPTQPAVLIEEFHFISFPISISIYVVE